MSRLLARLLFPLRHRPLHTEADPPYLDGLTFREWYEESCPAEVHADTVWCGRECRGVR